MNSQVKKLHRAKPTEKGSELLNLAPACIHPDKNSLHAFFRYSTLQESPYVQISVRQYHHRGMTNAIISEHLSSLERGGGCELHPSTAALEISLHVWSLLDTANIVSLSSGVATGCLW